MIEALLAVTGATVPRPEPLPLVTHPDSRLYQRCAEVAPDEFGPELAATLDRMVATMLLPRADGKPQGVGLAGPQVGFMRRVLVMTAGDRVFRMVNPVAIPTSETREDYESCLSLPDLSVKVARASVVQVSFLTPDGAPRSQMFGALAARIVQHEIDHLNGVTLLHHARRGAQFEYERRFGKAVA